MESEPQHERLSRYIESCRDDVCDADVGERLEELERLSESAEDRTDPDDLNALSTLGNPTRHRILRLLDESDGDLCVCEIEPVVDVSQSGVSHALSDLTDAGLVERRREGRWRFYTATRLGESLLGALDSEAER
ncbi:MAG: metalloregulator ArsR/SmtB family transcription factor [Halobacteria archaeon]|nr:metalloregulator ArsR/SmtB family transcription factor [Halobacteria archaeon]